MELFNFNNNKEVRLYNNYTYNIADREVDYT